MQKKKTWSFDRKLLLTFVTALFLVVPGAVAATSHFKENAPAQRVVDANSESVP